MWNPLMPFSAPSYVSATTGRLQNGRLVEAFHLGDQRVVDDADAVGVRDRDGVEESGVANPFEPRHLAVAVERVRPGAHR